MASAISPLRIVGLCCLHLQGGRMFLPKDVYLRPENMSTHFRKIVLLIVTAAKKIIFHSDILKKFYYMLLTRVYSDPIA